MGTCGDGNEIAIVELVKVTIKLTYSCSTPETYFSKLGAFCVERTAKRKILFQHVSREYANRKKCELVFELEQLKASVGPARRFAKPHFCFFFLRRTKDPVVSG